MQALPYLVEILSISVGFLFVVAFAAAVAWAANRKTLDERIAEEVARRQREQAEEMSGRR